MSLDDDVTRPVRWTIPREDTYETRGLKLADRKGQTGVYFHKVRLLPPLEVHIEVRCTNQYNPKNCVAVCWLDKKGRGVGGVYGRQLTTLKKFQVLGPKPATMAAINAQSDHKFTLKISADSYETSASGKIVGPAPLGKTADGHVALVWNGNVNVVVTKLTIKGKLDEDWAAEELGL